MVRKPTQQQKAITKILENHIKTQDADHFEVYLIDFGAVANPQVQGGGSTVAGTYGYMPPEQLQGMAGIEADYYALGATALHLLTGISPATMESKTFELQFDDVIAQKAPKTSKQCRELLHLLLAPCVEERPKNAHELLHFIQNVHDGKSPHVQNRVNRFSAMQRFFDRLRFFPGSWPKCAGYFKRLSTTYDPVSSSTIDALEYHYSIGDETYAGFVPLRNGDVTFLDESEYPKEKAQIVGECVVSYHPGDPCRCVLLPQTVYLPNTLLKKLSASQKKVLFSVKIYD